MKTTLIVVVSYKTLNFSYQKDIKILKTFILMKTGNGLKKLTNVIEKFSAQSGIFRFISDYEVGIYLFFT